MVNPDPLQFSDFVNLRLFYARCVFHWKAWRLTVKYEVPLCEVDLVRHTPSFDKGTEWLNLRKKELEAADEILGEDVTEVLPLGLIIACVAWRGNGGNRAVTSRSNHPPNSYRNGRCWPILPI